MKKLTAIFVVIIFFGFGCTNKGQSQNSTNNVTQTQTFISTAPTQASTLPMLATNTARVKLSPLEIAQKDYLIAYDEYVRLLRESGPQTMDTLQALANYQKKYQLYLMILEAEKKR